MRQVAISHYIKAWDTGQTGLDWTGALRTGSSTHALVEQVRRRSNILHHVRPARRGLEPLITFCLARAQTVAIYAVL